jgi:hypothetical protein
MGEKITLTIAEKIDRAKRGLSQSWIVSEMNKMMDDGNTITEVHFSRCKKGKAEFTTHQKLILSKILSTEI